MSGAPARGTSPRRPSRRHPHDPQHHNYYHHRNNNNEDDHENDSLDDYEKSQKGNEESRPKVNPIFLWALQREQRIIEVRCEDYDKRNRIKLTKTAHGWRSIPRTASNVYTTSVTRNCHNCERVCESPAAIASLSSATSSPNSARWSPAMITSSNLAPWSMSSASSTTSSISNHLATISSPSQESCETNRETIGSFRSRNQSDGESLNDFVDDACSRSATNLLGIEESSRKRRLRQTNRPGESDKKRCLRHTTSTNSASWSDRTNNNENSEDDSTNGSTSIGAESLDRRCLARKKRRRGRNTDAVGKRKKHQKNSECQESVMSSPRSWERLMNGTRFLNSGPVMDRMLQKDGKETLLDEEHYEETDRSKESGSHFGTVELEKAKRNQHLQPRVVLEPLRISGITETGQTDTVAKDCENKSNNDATKGIAEKKHEKEMDEVCTQEMIDSKDIEQKETVSMRDKTVIRDILSMIDSTGSPVLATDTPTAHLPSSLDSTKTNISGSYEHRNYSKSRERTSDDEKKRSLAIGRPSANTSDTLRSVNSKTLGGTLKSDAPSINERESLMNGKAIRRENIHETTDSSSNSDLGTSAEILEALRSTPGLSVSVTTRTSIGESRHESEQTLKNLSKRSTICVDKQSTNSSQHSRQSVSSNPRNNKEILCSQETGTEPHAMRFPERGFNGPGLATIVNRLSTRNDRQTIRRPDERLATNDSEKSIKQNGKIGFTTVSRSLPKEVDSYSLHSHKNQKDERSVNRKNLSKASSPAAQLRYLIDNSKVPIPDPLLVPRDRLPALAASPASEIPKLLFARPELRLPEALSRPDLLRDPDLLVISLGHLQQVLDQGDSSVGEYNYRSPHSMVLEDEDDEFGEENELVDENAEIDDDEDEEEDQDVPEQSLDLDHNEVIGSARVRMMEEKPRNQRVPPKLISCKPIGSLMPGPIDLSRNCVFRNTISNPTNRPRQTFTSSSRNHQSDASSTQLPPPPLLRVRSGLLKQESQLTSSDICVQDDSHLWHPLFGSQKRKVQHEPQQQQEQQTHRTSWHRTTLAS